MKKGIFILSITCLIFGLSSCKSKTSWVGTYSGVTPCADCSGIETQLTLNADKTYQLSWKYQDKGEGVFQESGAFQWSADKSIITLENLNAAQCPNMYKLGKESLIQLDLNGEEIIGDLAQSYVLTKVQ